MLLKTNNDQQLVYLGDANIVISYTAIDAMVSVWKDREFLKNTVGLVFGLEFCLCKANSCTRKIAPVAYQADVEYWKGLIGVSL